MANRTLVSIEAEVCEIDAAIRRKSNTPRRVLHRVCVCTCWTPNRVAAPCSLAAARACFRAFCLGLGAAGTNQLRRERALLLLSAQSEGVASGDEMLVGAGEEVSAGAAGHQPYRTVTAVRRPWIRWRSCCVSSAARTSTQAAPVDYLAGYVCRSPRSRPLVPSGCVGRRRRIPDREGGDDRLSSRPECSDGLGAINGRA
jgi:hypothetical protein